MSIELTSDQLQSADKQPVPSDGAQVWLDAVFQYDGVAVLVFFGLFCVEAALAHGALGLALCHDRTARRNAKVIFRVALIRFGILAAAVICRFCYSLST